MRKFLSALVLSVFLLIPLTAKSGMYDWQSKWQTIKTPHFSIHFPKNIEPLAQRSAEILEEIYPKVTEKWEYKPWRTTEVVLVDNTDESNGLSSVLPYNWMLIFAVPPAPDSSLAHYDDWLRMLLIHEYTHIVQIDAFGGAWWPIRILLGKTVAPSGIDPVWMREGLAQYDETIFTDAGRGRGAFSEMVVRASVLEKDFPTIDEADGLGWKWPSFKGAYVYGLKFTQWLVEKYGEDKFLEFDKNVRTSILMGMINHQAKRVYKKTFYQLWREWRGELEAQYDADRVKLEAAGLTQYDEVVPIKRDQQSLAPQVSPDGKKIAYTVESPHTKTQIRIRDLETGETKTIAKGQGAVQFSWSPDGRKLAYAAPGSYKRYYYYYDLWVYDLDDKKAAKITNGLRARDPEFDRDGKSLFFVAQGVGVDSVSRIDLETKDITALNVEMADYIQFANPRLSPDGKYLALSVWKKGDGWRIYRMNADGSNLVRLTQGAGVVIEGRPIWTDGGRFIIFSSDESGLNNLYRVSSNGGKQEKITNVLTGVFEPTGYENGSVYAQHYTAKGFELVKLNGIVPAKVGVEKKSKHKKTRDSRLETRASSILPSTGEQGVREGSEKPAMLNVEGKAEAVPDFATKPFKSGKYVAFGQSLFLPRFVLPGFNYANDTLFLSAATGGADVLRWQNWMATGTYRTDANFFGYSFQYWYNRFRPMFGLLVNDYAVDFGNLTFATADATGAIVSVRTVHFFEHRRAFAAFMGIPIQRHNFSAAYYYEDHMAKTYLTAPEKGALNLGVFAGFRGEYRYNDFERYPASISPENGRSIRLTSTWTNKRFGSADKNEQVVFSGDWREFILLGRHNVIALRAGGGITWGDPVVQGTFGLGGALGEGSFGGGGGSYNYFPLRGLPVSALSRTRAMLFSGEYRFPIVHTLRGIGTIPIFFKDFSGALLADYGNAWNAGENGSTKFSTFFDQFMLSVGGELRMDFIVGHGLPVHGRLGYAIIVKNRDRLSSLDDPIMKTSIKYGMLILALGTAF